MAWEPDYLTVPELKHYLRIDPNDTEDDTELGWAITSASRAVDKFCSDVANGLGFRRQFGKVAAPEARYYTPRWDTDLICWVIEIDDLMDVTGLIVQVDTSNTRTNYNQTITAYTLRPTDAPLRGRPYTQIAVSPSSAVHPTFYVDSAKVTAPWGWTSVIVPVKQATAIEANRINKRRNAPFRSSGSPQKGSEITEENVFDADAALILNTNQLVRLGWTV